MTNVSKLKVLTVEVHLYEVIVVPRINQKLEIV